MGPSLCLISHWLLAQREREGFYSLSPSQISMYIFTIIMLLNEDTKQAVIERKALRSSGTMGIRNSVVCLHFYFVVLCQW